MNLSTVKWASETKPNPKNCYVCSCVCIALCTIVAHNTARNRPDNFPLTLQTIIIAPMMSI